MTHLYKNLLIGAGNILNILAPASSHTLNKLYNPATSSMEALQGDWQKIGGDFYIAIEAIDQSIAPFGKNRISM